MKTSSIIGAIIGDIIGSVYEQINTRSATFPLFTKRNRFTDDTVMTIAIADWLLHGGTLPHIMQEWGKYRYPYRGYGGMFRKWLASDNPQPYISYGNGGAMRVSPVGFYAQTLEETLSLARQTAIVSHNHPDGIAGAEAIVTSVFLARNGTNKNEIRHHIISSYGYNLMLKCQDIPPRFTIKASITCPAAIIAFLDSSDYESAIRLAISLGGDSDTIACMAGGIAAAYYGIPSTIVDRARTYLPDDMLAIIDEFDNRI